MLTDSFTLYKVPRLTVTELAQCTLHVETATVLELRKVLQSSNPAHHAILRSAGLLPNEPLVPAMSKPSVSAMSKPSVPAMKEPSQPSRPSKLGVKRKVPFSDISSQTVVDLSGFAPRTYISTKRVERMDLTQV